MSAGRSALGIIPTNLITKQLDRLQPIVSFGAKRNAVLNKTPTFAEVTGNPKLAFTESVGVFASPKLAPAVAAEFTAHKGPMLAVLDKTPQLDDSSRKKAAAYLAPFFDQIGNPAELAKLTQGCLG